MCSSIIGLFSGNNNADHINIINTAPEYPAIFKPIPKIKLNPINNNPSINNQSTTGLPANAWNKFTNGP